jgi:glycosyltransferase involved in cell wall biosynthesis
MKIGIDARLIGETGVGRYIRNLIRELAVIDTQNEYVLFLRKNAFNAFQVPNARWTKRLIDVQWHSITEQIVLPWIFLREHLDILHVPYFNVPILFPGKYIVTIHDLTILHFDTGKASTLPYWLYKIRRIGYRIVLSLAIKRAYHIICVSNIVKKEILTRFHKTSDEVTVTYEGVDPALLMKTKNRKNPVTGKYFLFVGNAYPHKNIDMLLIAYGTYISRVPNPQQLVFVGPDDYFYTKLKQKIAHLTFAKCVVFLHGLSDDTIRALYIGATALLFPSLMEGFGLPAVEALSVGCPVIVSDIPVFHEILDTHATYVSTIRPIELATAMIQISHGIKSREIPEDFLSRFSLHVMAEKTRALYETA